MGFLAPATTQITSAMRQTPSVSVTIMIIPDLTCRKTGSDLGAEMPVARPTVIALSPVRLYLPRGYSRGQKQNLKAHATSSVRHRTTVQEKEPCTYPGSLVSERFEKWSRKKRWSDSLNRRKGVSAMTSAQWSTEQPFERRSLRLRLPVPPWRGWKRTESSNDSLRKHK